jgi:hypothetical protein
MDLLDTPDIFHNLSPTDLVSWIELIALVWDTSKSENDRVFQLFRRLAKLAFGALVAELDKDDGSAESADANQILVRALSPLSLSDSNSFVGVGHSLRGHR